MLTKKYTDEEVEDLVADLNYKYDIGCEVLVESAIGGRYWGKIVKQHYGFWGLFSSEIRSEYLIESEFGTIVQCPENWLETKEERDGKFQKITRLKDKIDVCEDEEIQEALLFYTKELERSMFPDEMVQLYQCFK